MNPRPALEMHESEASFQAVVDPYARADFFLSFGEEGVEIEEGFITFPTLPGGLLVKVGKMRAAFGKVNTLHTTCCRGPIGRSSPTNLVGGEEGIDDAGISVARLIPNPWLFLEATGPGVPRRFGRRVPVERARRPQLRRPPARRIRTSPSRPTSISASRTRAVTTRRGSSTDIDVGRFTTELYGIDATVRWRPLRRSIYHSFVGRAE